MQPISNYARSGDTVMIALGGTHESNAQVSVLKKENITNAITDSIGTSLPVKLRYLYRVYGDPTSAYGYRVYPQYGGRYETYTPPYSGQWMAVIDLADPVTGNPLPLASGAATISVTSPDLVSFIDYPGWGWTWTNGDLSSIPFEILEGTGQSNPLNYLGPVSYDPMTALEPMSQIEVEPTGVPQAMVGGAEFVFSYVHDSFGAVASPVRVVPSTPDPGIQLGYTSTDQGDGTSLLKVVITNPNGFMMNNVRDYSLMAGKSPFRSLGFNIVWDNSAGLIMDSNWQQSIQLISSKYVDIDGVTMTELTASMAKVN